MVSPERSAGIKASLGVRAAVLAVVALAGVLLGRAQGARKNGSPQESAVHVAPAVAHHDVSKAATSRASARVGAVPPVPPSEAAEERDRYVSAFRQSGPAEQQLQVRARDAVEAFKRLELEGWSRFEAWECHRLGCFGSVIHDSTNTVSVLTTKMTQATEFSAWNAEKFRSGPIERADGSVEVTWFLYAATP